MLRRSWLLSAGGLVALPWSMSAGGGSADADVTEARVRDALAAIDQQVPQWLARTGVPGASVSVVFRGETVHARGYGVRRVGQAAAVDADTVFQLASVSKPVGATVMAVCMPGGAHALAGRLVDWNTPIDQLLPDFALAYPSPADNARLTLGDLYAHRSGLPDHAGDVLEDMGYTRSQILQRLRLVALKPYGSYDYTNFGLTAAAQAMAQAQGIDWESLSQHALYEPLGMRRTSSRFADFAAQDNRAWGHVVAGISWDSYGAMPARYVVQEPPRQPDAQSPAGGVSSSAADMAQWMKLVLAGGVWQGKPLASAAALQAAMTARPGGKYGYGFNVGADPRGHASVSHSGAFLMGAATSVVLWPQAQLGITVLTNAPPRGLAEAIALRLGELAWGDVAVGQSSTDWLASMQAAMHDLYKPEGRLAGEQPPAQPEAAPPLADCTGRYVNDYFGTAQVTVGQGGLLLTIGPAAVSYPLRHWSGRVFVFSPGGESAAPQSLSTVEFADGAMRIERYAEDLSHGLFTRAAAAS